MDDIREIFKSIGGELRKVHNNMFSHKYEEDG